MSKYNIFETPNTIKKKPLSLKSNEQIYSFNY